VTQVIGIWQSAFASGDYSKAGLLADQILDLAQREGSRASFGFAYRAQINVSLFRGDLVASEECFARLSRFLDADGFRQFPGAAVEAIGIAGLCALISGRADLARERIAQGIAFGQDSGRPYDLATGRFFESLLCFFLREPLQAEVAALRALALAEEHGFPFTTCLTRPPLGWARAQLGSAAEGVALIRQGLADLAEAGTRIAITSRLTQLAEAQTLDGKIDDALISIEEALQTDPQDLFNRPNALTFRGELRLKVGQAELAKADFREAIALAQKMKAKAWELRATISLARLLAKQGRRDEARTMFAEIYNWFREGFDTPDLKEAKALLDELSA
jgi:tetratricopeptide (TPR) repeat protein